MDDSPIIVGYGHTKFAKHEGLSLEDLIVEAAKSALDNAGVAAMDGDAIFLGHFNSGMVSDSFASSLALQADPGSRLKPATKYENACASGSAAIFGALDAIQSGRLKTALVIGAEKMTELDTSGVATALGRASYSGNVQEASMSFA